MKMDIVVPVLLWLMFGYSSVLGEPSACEASESKSAPYTSELYQAKKYLLYDVNPGEGFNLRRDVYIRIAHLVRKLRDKGDNWTLVLPPWGPLYHWKSKLNDEIKQLKIPWSQFFNISSLSHYVPVIELVDYVKDYHHIDIVYILQYYADTFQDGQSWVDKFDISDCLAPPSYHFVENNEIEGWFWSYIGNIYAKNLECVSLQGQSSTLAPLLVSAQQTSIMLDRAEIMLHDVYGDAEYWRVRRSMLYSSKLIDFGNDVRKRFLNSTDLADKTDLKNYLDNFRIHERKAIGGPYVGVHLRRGDFIYGRNQSVPSLQFAARQISKAMKGLNLTLAYISTDATESEFNELKKWLPSAFRFVPTKDELLKLLDGGVAIVDQWICAHARYFIGTHESTFSFRIQEDREILGFHPDTTFNRLCGDIEGDECDQPTRWKIVF